ncbi:MAG: efflux RND transporter periplasmic adaptor subunit [Dehalococcoidales bacterium]|nr:efflux RND transporter periplasmic adaptor subunit [Dehalococcoidales bacterium]
MKKWKIASGILTGLILIGLIACNPLGEAEEVEELVKVVKGDLTVSISGSGNIKAVSEAELTFASGGQIEEIFVKEGDEVSQNEILARLNTDALSLALTKERVALTKGQVDLTKERVALTNKQVALTQEQLALTKAQLAQQTAEFNLNNTLDKKETLELALFNAQIDVKTAKKDLDETQDIYTWPEIKVAQKDVDKWKAYVNYVVEQNLPAATVTYAQARLTAAEGTLDAMINSYDTEEVAIAKLELEATEMTEAQAQKDLDKLTDEIALKELEVESAKESVEQAHQSIELARQSIELARQSVEQAEQSLDQAKKDLNETTVTAPFDGVIARVSAEEGDTVTTAMTIVHAVNISSMELTVEIDEIDIPKVELDQETIVTFDALPDDEFTGSVVTILPLPEEVSGVMLYDVKIKLDIPEGFDIKVGMSASTDIIIDRRSNVLLVPDRTIKKDDQGNHVVMVVIDEEITARPVVTGISDGFNTEIINGLREEETVIETRIKR